MNIRIVRRGEQIVELRRMIFNESKGKKRSSFHHSVSVKKRRTIKCTKTLWFNYSRVSWKTEPRKQRGGLSVFIIYVSLFQAPTLLTFLHVRFAPLSISWTLSWFYCRNSVFFFFQQFCRVFDFFPCILYPLMYARMFVLFGIDWFVVVSIA